MRGGSGRDTEAGTPVACLHYGSLHLGCSVAVMAQFPPPRRAYETWPDVDVETVPEVYRKAWALRDNLVKTVEYYVAEGWAKNRSDFARRCGLHPSVLSRWVTGDVWPSADTVAAVEAAVHMPMWPYQKAPSRRGLRSKGGYDYP